MAGNRVSMVERSLQPMPGEEDPIKEVLSSQNLEMMSELPPNMIKAMASAYMVADLTGCEELKRFCRYIMTFQVSKDRKGRIEYIEGVTSRRREEDY